MPSVVVTKVATSPNGQLTRSELRSPPESAGGSLTNGASNSGIPSPTPANPSVTGLFRTIGATGENVIHRLK